MSYIPRSCAVDPLSDGMITLLILPEYPSMSMPIRAWMNGQRVAANDYAVERDALSFQGDFSNAAFEVDYFVAVTSFVPRTARLQGLINGTSTILSLPELPVDSLPLTLHTGGQRISMTDYSRAAAVVSLNDVWEGCWFDVDYYISQVLSTTVIQGGSVSVGTGNSSTQSGQTGGYSGTPSGDYAGSGAMNTSLSTSTTTVDTDIFAGGNVQTFTPDGVWTNQTGAPIEPEVPLPTHEPETIVLPSETTPLTESFVPDPFWEGVS